MKRLLQVLIVVAVVAGTSLAVLPPTATVAPESDLQVMASGPDGLAAAPTPCERVRHTRLCFESTKTNCPFVCR